VRYVGLGALSAMFWLLVATLRVAVNGDFELRPEAVDREAAAEQRPVPSARAKLGSVNDCGVPGIYSIDRTLDVANNPISKTAVVAGMNAVKPLVSACYLRYRVPGFAMVNVVIDKDGRVCAAAATGKFAGTPTGACVEQAVRTARFPPSDGLSTLYPFPLR
jgi:hypothetical protein